MDCHEHKAKLTLPLACHQASAEGPSKPVILDFQDCKLDHLRQPDLRRQIRSSPRRTIVRRLTLCSKTE